MEQALGVPTLYAQQRAQDRFVHPPWVDGLGPDTNYLAPAFSTVNVIARELRTLENRRIVAVLAQRQRSILATARELKPLLKPRG